MEIILDNKIIKLDKADTFIKKLLGLMHQKEITKGMFFPHTRSIHTFFMKDNIDVIMINKDNIIVYYKKNVSKNKIIIKKEAYHTIELPKNTINNIQIGHKLTIKS